MSESRTEAILENMLGASHALEPPQSRVEAALTAILNGEEYTGEAKSRVEMLLKEISQQGGGNVDVEALAVDANGTYTAPSGKAYSPVTVDVEPDLMAKSVTENGTYQAASDNVDGYSAVTVDVEANVGTKSITQNGTYTAASEQLDGYSEVTVNVSGGGGQEVPEKDVNFIDYDGTVLYSYTAQEALALTELPPNPSHEGLTAQGWNYTLAEVKTEVNAVGGATVGQMYVTDDGKTRFYIHIDENTISAYRAVHICMQSSAKNNCEIDWGDGTVETKGSTSGMEYSHLYTDVGDYIVTVEVKNGTVTFKSFDSNSYSVMGKVYSYYPTTRLQKLELGTNVILGDYVFYNNYALKTITFPTDVGFDGVYMFNNVYSLTAMILPRTVQMGVSFCASARILQRISIPPTVTTMKALSYASNLNRCDIPSSTTFIDSGFLRECQSVTKITVPAGVTEISTNVFYNTGIMEFHFKSITPPTIASTSFYNLLSDAVIYVPYSADHSILNTYKTATNWSAYATKIQEEPA